MSKNALIGIAGVHYVVSELSRRGVVALPAIKNIAAYDIVALNIEGTWHANIQVKASSNPRAQFFPMPAADKVRTGRYDFYVLVRWIESELRYEGFLLKGKEARIEVQDAVRRQRTNIRKGTRTKEFPTVHVGHHNAEKAARWSADWAKWMDSKLAKKKSLQKSPV